MKIYVGDASKCLYFMVFGLPVQTLFLTGLNINTNNLIRLVVILPVGDRPSAQKLLVGLVIKLCSPVGHSP